MVLKEIKNTLNSDNVPHIYKLMLIKILQIPKMTYGTEIYGAKYIYRIYMKNIKCKYCKNLVDIGHKNVL